MKHGMVIVFAMAVLGAAACQDIGTTPPVTDKTLADTADQTLFGVRVVMANQGIQRAVLMADTAYTYQDNSRFELRVVRTTFYTDAGVKNGTLTSNEGTYNVRAGTMEGRGNVVVISEDGRRLETPQLRYDPGRNEISSDSAFVLTQPTEVISGIGFIADPDLNNIKILQNAQGRSTKPLAQPDR